MRQVACAVNRPGLAQKSAGPPTGLYLGLRILQFPRAAQGGFGGVDEEYQ